MTIGETRRKNLRAIIEKQGGVSKLARAMGYSNPSFLSQMAGPKPTREITEKSARKLETAMGLPTGALDHDETVYPTGELQTQAAPGAAPASPRPAAVIPATAPRANGVQPAVADSAALVAEVIRLVGGACEAERVTPSMSKFADVVALVYQDAMGGAKPTEDKARMLARLLK